MSLRPRSCRALVDECELCGDSSPQSAYDNDEWIRKLESFIRQCNRQKKPRLGSVLATRSLRKHSGAVGKSAKGWGLGAHEYKWIDGG